MTDPNNNSAQPAQASEPLVRIRGLTAGYVSGIDIIHDIDLELTADEIVTIIGPNGAGKSTLMKGLMGALPYVTGERYLAGQNVSDLDAPRMVAAGVGYVPQRENVFASLSIRENLEMGGYRRRGTISSSASRKCWTCSPRCASAPASAPADSPAASARCSPSPAPSCSTPTALPRRTTRSLSPAARVEIFERVSGIHAAGVGVLLVEQNATEALGWSDRGVVNGQRRKKRSKPPPRKCWPAAMSAASSSAAARIRTIRTRPQPHPARPRGEHLIEIAQLILVGWIVGSIIAVGAVGVTLVYGILGVGDFSFGDTMTVGMSSCSSSSPPKAPTSASPAATSGPLSFGWGLVVGALLAITLVVGLVLLLEVLVYRRLRRRGGGFLRLRDRLARHRHHAARPHPADLGPPATSASPPAFTRQSKSPRACESNPTRFS